MKFKILLIVITLVGCTSLPPIEDTVTSFDFGEGLYQVKVVQKDTATIQSVWVDKSISLCPSGYKTFDSSSNDVEGGGYREGGPGAIGFAINEGIKERGKILVGYILCNDSKLTIEQARKKLWG